jgi:hypothetical protein
LRGNRDSTVRQRNESALKVQTQLSDRIDYRQRSISELTK